MRPRSQTLQPRLTAALHVAGAQGTSEDVGETCLSTPACMHGLAAAGLVLCSRTVRSATAPAQSDLHPRRMTLAHSRASALLTPRASRRRQRRRSRRMSRRQRSHPSRRRRQRQTSRSRSSPLPPSRQVGSTSQCCNASTWRWLSHCSRRAAPVQTDCRSRARLRLI